ncbi:MAG: helix-turn-helix transcriptional regulator [Ktedonobacterales bacterium]|nr:helix-turn-helix transcriptional regulator [Ktedonobacterales bacterium]
MPLPYLRAWRAYRVLSQRELQELSGVAKTTLIRVENGAPATTATIAKLATALNVTREQLVREDPTQANTRA